jgi:procollagen-proline 3-dioxygenase 1
MAILNFSDMKLSFGQITDGERLTLALWFSRDGSHDEDTKLVSLLSQHLLHKNMAGSCIPFPASSNMYWSSQDQASNDQFGFNICWARLHVLGYDIYISQDSSSGSDVSELMAKPVRLVRGSELLDHEFVNILHALQVF